MYPRICYSNRVTNTQCTPITGETLMEIMQDPHIQEVCDQIKLLDDKDQEEKQRLKRELPIVCFHAQGFKDGKRSNQGAIPSGLVMLDIDHVENPDEYYQQLISQERIMPDGTTCTGTCLLAKCCVYLVAKTPSAHGLRIVANRSVTTDSETGLRTVESIPDAQKRIADMLGIAAYDECTKDLARASYLVPWSYVYWYYGEGLSFKDEEEAIKVAENMAVLTKTTKQGLSPNGSSTEGQSPTNLDAYNLPYLKRMAEILESRAGGAPAMGMRNAFLLGLAMKMRYVCDFKVEVLKAVLPTYGLSDQEFTTVIQHAVARPRHSDTPQEVRLVHQMVSEEIALAEDEAKTTIQGQSPNGSSGKTTKWGLSPNGSCEDLSPETLPLPAKLPKDLTMILNHYPENFRAPLLVALMPVLGTLATQVHFPYLDNAEHSFSFMSCVTAPAASGKSFIRHILEMLMTPIIEQDACEREKEQDYKDALRAAKNSKQQPSDPHACPRYNGVNISIAKLLQLMDYAEGKHLFGFSAELDTLLKSERAGVWSQKNDIYRLGFDNDWYGQQYMSDNSYSANVKVYYNLLLTGTPGALKRYFKDVEDGLVTRWCFAQLPDNFGQSMPEIVPYTPKETERVVEMARWLDAQSGMKQPPVQLQDAIDQWLEEWRIKAVSMDSRTLDTLRRRAAVIGYRGGMLMYILLHERAPKIAAEFAVWLAEYTLRQQYALFGEAFDEVANGLENKEATQSRDMLALMPKEFTIRDVQEYRIKVRKSTKIATIRSIITRWLGTGLIYRDPEKNCYIKVNNEQKA